MRRETVLHYEQKFDEHLGQVEIKRDLTYSMLSVNPWPQLGHLMGQEITIVVHTAAISSQFDFNQLFISLAATPILHFALTPRDA